MTCTAVSETSPCSASFLDTPQTTLASLTALPPHEEKVDKVALPVLEKIKSDEQAGSSTHLDEKLIKAAFPEKEKAAEVPVPLEEKATAQVAIGADEKIEIRQKIDSISENVTVKKTSKAEVLSSEAKEKAFVSHRKRLMTERLEAWKKDFNPAPCSFLSSFSDMREIVRIESLDVIAMLMKKLSEAPSRQKIASLLRKNEKLLQDNMFWMDSATTTKMEAARGIIKRELDKLGAVEESPKQVGEKKSRIVSSEDPLFSQKTHLVKKLEEWKVDFAPRPAFLLALVPGATERLVNKANGLFDGLFKRLIKADTKGEFVELLEMNQKLITHYCVLVNSSTKAKLTNICEILGEEKKDLVGVKS